LSGNESIAISINVFFFPDSWYEKLNTAGKTHLFLRGGFFLCPQIELDLIKTSTYSFVAVIKNFLTKDQTMLDVLSESLYQNLKPYLKLTKDKKSVLYSDVRLTPARLSAQLTPDLRQQFNIFKPELNEADAGYIKQYFIDRLKNTSPTDLNDALKDYRIGKDIITGKRHVIKNGAVMPYDFEIWKSNITPEQFDILLSLSIDMVVAFNPHKKLSWRDSIKTPNGLEEFIHYNSYIPATWTMINKPTNFDLVERFIPDFLQHLFPREDERDYVLWWLYNLCHRRCQDILVLVGVQGNGKNTFMNLARIIADKHNSVMASKSFGKEKFNSEVYKRKLVCLDEYKLTEVAKESMKTWCNDFISVEGKGQDPITLENYCSFIIANNYDKNIIVEYKDRRFTIPELAKRDISYVWDVERLREFQAILKDSQEFEETFPHWVIKTVEEKNLHEKYSKHLVLKTPKFYQLVDSNKPRWFQAFMRLLKHQESVNVQDVRNKTRNGKLTEDALAERLQLEHQEREDRNEMPLLLAETIEDDHGNLIFKSFIYESSEDVGEMTI